MYYFPKDFWDLIIGKRHKYVPPRGLIYTGSPASSESYIQQGLHQLNLLKTEANLQPNHSVLDIGSGVGRTAIALSGFLYGEGRYEGFDVVENGVNWCNKKIKKDHPNFNFTYVPLFNDLYNESTLKATDFSFPYPDNSFDVIFSFSVFTHMQIEEIAHYLKEIKRVLKPNGKSLNTFFTFNKTTEKSISELENFAFPIKKEGFRLMNEKVKSGNIALDVITLESITNDAGLTIQKLIDGFWKNPKNTVSSSEYQDIVVFSNQ
jgi:ubiquinone/menaquinone biosynthesis C-methylase UbiE